MGAIERLFVATGARGRGLGGRLLATASDAAYGRGRRPVLEVLDQDRAAIALYERLGWRRVATIDGGLGGTAATRLHAYVGPVSRRAPPPGA